MWIDVTWGAGGSTADTTLSLCETAMDVTGLDVLMHLTCTNVTVDMTRNVLQRCKEKGLCNILALRGDPPANAAEWTATEGGFAHAVDLVRFIRKEFGDFFCIGIAAYPEGHLDAESFDKDLQFYKDKARRRGFRRYPAFLRHELVFRVSEEEPRDRRPEVVRRLPGSHADPVLCGFPPHDRLVQDLHPEAHR